MATKFVKDGTLFSKASKTTKSTAAKPDKDNVKVTDKELSAAINNFVKYKKDIDTLTSQLKAADSIIKAAGEEMFISHMNVTGKRKESFILSNDTNSVLYIIQDSYVKANLDEERIGYLKDTYGEDIIDVKSKYVFDSDMVEKYGELISKAIEKIKGIPDADKAQIIKVEESPSIRKGTIEKLRDIAVAAKTSVLALFKDIQPTQQLKIRGDK